MKIETSEVGFDIHKQLTDIQGSPFQLEDVTPAIERQALQPGLLTALLGPSASTSFNRTDTFKYDEFTATVQLPDGKPYSERGKDLKKDRPRQLRFAIPSFGIRMNTAPQDYVGRRREGSTEFLTEADVIARQMTKADRAWSLFDEIGIANILTADTNIVRGGPFEQFNFYTTIVGSARPAKVSMQLTTANIDHEQNFRDQRRLLTQELERSMDSSNMIVCICGDTFFDQRYAIEQNSGLARPLNFGVDLASQPINEQTFGTGTFQYPWFDSRDGIRYINYGANIISGTKLIADTDAYLVPVGSEQLLHFSYAPSQTRTYANTDALAMYAWTMTDEFRGVTTFMESNKLFSSINPRLIRALVNV